MSKYTVPPEIELTPQSKALLDALFGAAKTHPTEAASAPSALTPPALGEYWPGQGGLYAGVLPAIGNQPAVHMTFSTEEASRIWGPYNKEVTAARSRHNGLANTLELLALDDEFPAALWAAHYTADGHSDFHQPSQAELFLASLHAPQIFEKEGLYWSSTQYSANHAFVQDFEYGTSIWRSKDNERRVRAVRWIPLQHLE